MKIVIVVYDGIDIWDLAFAYKAFNSLENISLKIVTNKEGGEITCKDKNLVLGGFLDLYDVNNADILWLCQGESNISSLIKDNKFKSKILELALGAKKTICIGGSSLFLVDGFIEKEKCVASHPAYSKLIKKAKVNYVPDLILNNDNIISTSSRVGVILAILELYTEFFSENSLINLLSEFNLKEIGFLTENQEGIDQKKRIRDLKKLHKQVIKLEPNKNLLKLKVDSIKNCFVFYVQDNLNFLSFALIYSILSNYNIKNNFIVADKIGQFNVNGGDFYIKSTHAIHQITRVNTLVISGGEVINNRLKDNFLKHWISQIVPKTVRVICLDGAERLLGVSGVLVDYDPFLEQAEEEKLKIDGKFVFLQNAYELMIYLKHNLSVLSDEKQSELLKSEYFL